MLSLQFCAQTAMCFQINESIVFASIHPASSSELEHRAVRALHFPAGANVCASPTYTFNCEAMNISLELNFVVEKVGKEIDKLTLKGINTPKPLVQVVLVVGDCKHAWALERQSVHTRKQSLIGLSELQKAKTYIRELPIHFKQSPACKGSFNKCFQATATINPMLKKV